MPRATAVWLVDNTALTFEQISEFCGLHMLEIQAIADGEAGNDITGLDPIANGQLTHAEVDRCEADTAQRLQLTPPMTAESILGKKKGKYTPVSKRQDKPDAIAWIVKHHPELNDQQICRLLGTTRPTIKSIREKSHWNAENIKPRSPLQLGLCTQAELDEIVEKARTTAEKAAAKPKRTTKKKPAAKKKTTAKASAKKAS